MSATRYADFITFAADLAVPLPTGAAPLGSCWAPFQKADFKALAPSIEALAAGTMPPVRRFWIERTKGGSKDTDLAIAMLYVLGFAAGARRMQVIADDQQQASESRLIVEAILAIDSPLNRLLSEIIVVTKSVITSKRNGSTIEILTRDDRGSHGARPDLVLANELSHIGDEGFASTVLDNADKIPSSVVVVATNAGFCDSWQARWREIATTSARWHFSALTEPAPWVSEADLEESRRRNPPARFDRLWRGVWATGSGDGIGHDWIEAAIDRECGPPGVPPGHIDVILGLDLGLKFNFTGLAIVSVDTLRHKVSLLTTRCFRPPGGGMEIDLAMVEREIIGLIHLYRVNEVLADQHQSSYLIQRLSRLQICAVKGIAATVQSAQVQAMRLINAFHSGEISLYRDAQLVRDLKRMSIIERPANNGFRLVSPTDSDGNHGDVGAAFSLACTQALLDLDTLPPPEVLKQQQQQQQQRLGAFGDYPSVGTAVPRGGAPLDPGFYQNSAAMMGRPINLRGNY